LLVLGLGVAVVHRCHQWDVVAVHGIGTSFLFTDLEFALGVELRLVIGKGVAEASQSLFRSRNLLPTFSVASTAAKMPVLVKGASPFANIAGNSCMACVRPPSLVARLPHFTCSLVFA
jgi:hypothetical protein